MFQASSQTGLSSVTIYRDDFGVAHLYAPDAASLWYANGYVQGQDRLWELDLLRHLGYGEAASIIGTTGLAFDLTTRRDLYSRAELETMWAAAPPDLRGNVEIFAAGVNRAAAEMAATGNLPAEFAALHHAFEPWQGLDTAAVASFLLARFGTGGGEELDNARLLGQLESTLADPARAWTAFGDVVWTDSDSATTYATIPHSSYPLDDLLPAPKADPADVPPAQQAAAAAAKNSVSFGLATIPLTPATEEAAHGDLGPFRFKWGSNALLVSPKLSETGKALVGGGPQMGYFVPQVPYEVGLHGGGVDVVGVGVGGAPGVVVGRTGTFAWTVTSGISDQTDVVALPATGSESFAWDHAERALECRTEHHRVVAGPAATGGAPEFQLLDQRVCLAPVQPTGQPKVLAPVVGVTDANGDGTPEYHFASRASSRMRELDSAAQWLSLAEKRDLEGFRAAFDGFAFTFNFHFAGRDGAGREMACFHHVGLQPLRNLALDPRLPTPAGNEWTWHGFLTGVHDGGGQLPRACNPGQGYFANWNNLAQKGWSAGDGRELWGSVHRVERLDKEVREFLDAKAAAVRGPARLNLEDVKAILKDAATQDSLAHQIVPAILASTPAGVAPGATQALAAWAADDYPWRSGGLVSNPNGQFYDDPGHTVYDRLLPALLERLVGDEQGDRIRAVNFDPQTDGDPHAADHGEHNNMFSVLVDALTGATSHNWCDNVTTPAAETCAATVAAAYEAAGLVGYQVPDAVPLTAQHFTRFASLGAGPAFTMPMTNRATYYHFHVGSETGLSRSAMAAGNSGHINAVDLARMLGGQPPPPHLGDQLPLYVGFQLKSVPVTQVEADAASTAPPSTLIVPAI